MATHASRVWDEIQAELRGEVGSTFYDVWISVLQAVSVGEAKLLLVAPNQLYADWVRENYLAKIERLLRARAPQLAGQLTARVLTKEHLKAAELELLEQVEAPGSAEPGGLDEEPAAPSAPAEPRFTPSAGPVAPQSEAALLSLAPGERAHQGLSREKTFDSFIVGDCNQFAHAAASAVADDPGDRQYNPLFIYGSTGLGKTHLMHAVGNRIVQRQPGTRVIYVTAEEFTNEMIDALRYKQMHEFRSRFRNEANLLLMDDVQFLTGKDRTQEELFHTFEWLRERGRQIVFTADVLPREIKGFEPRLRTRCESGMVADMQPPDLETLVAIIESKSAERGLRMPKDLSQYLATRVRGSIRELEGVLNNLSQLCRLHGRAPTLDFARQHLARMLPDGPPEVDAKAIIEAVAQAYSVEVSALMGSSRVKGLVTPRHVSMWLIRRHTQLSSTEVGRLYEKDHSTVLHACGKVEKQLEADAGLRSIVQMIERNLLR